MKPFLSNTQAELRYCGDHYLAFDKFLGDMLKGLWYKLI